MTRPGKTGSDGRPWIELEHPKPPRVHPDHIYDYTASPPPQRSQACAYWVRQIERGWLPNRHIQMGGYDGMAHWFGVYIWEQTHVLYPLLESKEANP